MRRIFPALVLTGLLAACGGDEIPYYFFDTLPVDTGGGDTGGTDIGPVGCQTADDCDEGETCAEGVCLPSCASDDECTGSAPLCEAIAGVCVECLSESNCEANQTCEAYACASLCETPEDCPGGECVDGICAPVEPICDAGAVTCQDGSVATCLDDGSGYDLLPCDDGECVVADGSASCVSAECEPLERGCFDAQTAFECAEDGSERITIECEEGTECEDGTCVAVAVPACIEVNPSRINFGVVEIGTEEVQTFTLSPCDEPVEIVAIDFIEDPDSFSVFSPISAPFTLADPIEIEVAYLPAVEDDNYGELAIETRDGFEVVVLTGEGASGEGECTFPEVRCAVGDGEFASFIEVPVFADVECTGGFTVADVAEYSWELIDAPSSSDLILPSTSAEAIVFAPDVEGIYVIEMNIVDTDGSDGCAPATAEVSAVGGTTGDLPAIAIALTWDNASDLDNHLKIDGSGRWGAAPDDCFYSNMASSWGAVLDTDDTDGFGPETINVGGLTEPIVVRAGAWSQRINDGSTTATMTLTVDGEVQERLSTDLTATSQFWEVWEIMIVDGGVEVNTIDTVTNRFPDGK